MIKRLYIWTAVLAAILIVYFIFILGNTNVEKLKLLTEFTGGVVIGLLGMIIGVFGSLLLRAWKIEVTLKPVILVTLITGSCVLLVEYVASVIYNINLNQYVSIAWCDLGIILILMPFLTLLWPPIWKKIKSNFIDFLEKK